MTQEFQDINHQNRYVQYKSCLTRALIQDHYYTDDLMSKLYKLKLPVINAPIVAFYRDFDPDNYKKCMKI